MVSEKEKEERQVVITELEVSRVEKLKFKGQAKKRERQTRTEALVMRIKLGILKSKIKKPGIEGLGELVMKTRGSEIGRLGVDGLEAS